MWQDEGDPRVVDKPLMGDGPWTMLVIMSSYVLFVKKIGPRLMKDRDPFQLRGLIIAYNAIMVATNFWFFTEAIVCMKYGNIDNIFIRYYKELNSLPLLFNLSH